MGRGFSEIEMKFLLFTDTHISSKVEFSKPTEDGLTDYLHRVIRSFEWVESLIESHDPDSVAMLGDLFDTTGFVDTLSLHVGSKVCSSLISTCCALEKPLYWVVGNHDIYSEAAHNLGFLGDLSTWGQVVDKPRIVRIQDTPILFLPWGYEPKEGEYSIILSHTEIKGGMLNPKARSTEGMDPNHGPWIFNGHYHLPDQLSERCVQVGSLLSKDFRDGPSLCRGVAIVDYDGSNCIVTRIANPHEVPYRTVRVLEHKDSVLWKARLDEGITGLEDSYVKVVYDEAYKEVAEQVSYLTKGSRLELKSEPIPELKDSVVNEAFSPEENFKKYVENVLLFDEEKDAELVLSKGLGYIESVKKDFNTSTQPVLFKSLYIKGFQSIGEIEVDLKDQGLIWVGGPNGVGKTTLLESLFWALTGRSARHGDRSGDEVIGWHTDTCEVSVDLTIGGHDYTITRGRKPNRVELYLGETSISARRARDTDKIIQELVGRSKDVLQHSIFLTSGLDTKFTSLSYPDRIRLLESITDAGVYSKVESKVKKDIKQVYRGLSYEEGAKESIEKRLNSLNSRLPEVQGEIVQVRRELSTKQDSLRRDLKELVNQRKDFVVLLKDKEAERRKIEEEYSVLDRTASMVRSARVSMVNRLTELETTARYLKQDIKNKLDLAASGRCPTCFSSNVKKSLTGYIEKQQTELSEVLSERNEKILPKSKFYENEEKKQESKLANLDLRVRQYRNEEDRLNIKLQEIERTINGVKVEINLSSSKVDKLEAKKEEIQLSIAEERSALQNSKEKISSLQLEERIYSFLVKAFSTNGIRASMLSSTTVPFLNSRIEQYASTLSLPFSLTNKVETKSGAEDNKVDIALPGKRTYKACSRGERRRIDLAVQCAINDLAIATGGSRVNLLVADEVIDPLDDAGVKSFIDILQTKSKDSTVILITHKPFIDSYAAKRWLLTKEYDVTNLQTV